MSGPCRSVLLIYAHCTLLFTWLFCLPGIAVSGDTKGAFVCMYTCAHTENSSIFLEVSTSLFPIFRVSNRVVLRSLGGSLIHFFLSFICLCVYMHGLLYVRSHTTCIEKERSLCRNIWSCLLSAVQAGQKPKVLLPQAVQVLWLLVCVRQHSRPAVQICLFLSFVGMGMVERWSNVAQVELLILLTLPPQNWE